MHHAIPRFADDLERAGLRQSTVATQALMSRFYLAHIAASRRNISGVLAARIAAIYGAATEIGQDAALAQLFVPIAAKKHGDTPRKRGERGRFVRDELPPTS